MRVVLDTNVLVSAVLTPTGKAAAILDLIASRRIILLISPAISSEYEEVLSRKEFPFDRLSIQSLLDFIQNYSESIPSTFAKLQLPDIDDIPFLACALEGKADCLITGNKKHFPERLCRPVPVYSPSDFLDFLKAD